MWHFSKLGWTMTIIKTSIKIVIMKTKGNFLKIIATAFLTISSIISSNIYAQNWLPYNHMNICNYATSNAFADIVTIKTDSFAIIKSDTIYYLNKIIDEINYHDPLVFKPQFLLSNAEISGNYMIFKDSSEYVFKIDAKTGDTWTFDSTFNITAMIVFEDTDTIFGQVDSLKHIVLSNSDTIVVSKEFGIVSFYFYDKMKRYNLIGIENLDLGYRIPAFNDFFDFNVSDIFEYKERKQKNRPNGGIDYWYNCYFKYEILSKEKTYNGFKYGIKKVLSDTTIINPVYCPVCPPTYHSIQNTDTIYFTYSNNSFLDWFNNEGAIGSQTNYMHRIYFSNDLTFDVNVKKYEFIKPYPIVHAPVIVNTSFGINFGLIHKDSIVYGDGSESLGYSIDLIGCKKDAIVYGTIHVDSYFTEIKQLIEDEAIYIYPNPAENFIYVKLNDLLNNAEIRIIDLNGQVLLSEQIIGNLNRIDLTTLKTGIYSIIVILDSKLLTKSIIKL